VVAAAVVEGGGFSVAEGGGDRGVGPSERPAPRISVDNGGGGIRLTRRRFGW